MDSNRDYYSLAEAAYKKGDVRAAEALCKQSLVNDLQNQQSWRLLYRIKGRGEPFALFQTTYIQKYFPTVQQYARNEIKQSLDDTQPIRKPVRPESVSSSSLIFLLTSISKRIFFILIGVIVVNFIAHSYALVSLQSQMATNPYGSKVDGAWPPIFTAYMTYAQNLLNGDLGTMPGGISTVASVVGDALSATLGLFLLAVLISAVLGLVIGLACVHVEPARVTNWLAPITSVGLAMPGFFLGTLFIAFTLYWLLGKETGTQPLLPIFGFGWDLHLALPLIALIVRPTAQIAQSTASLLAGELDKQYVTTSRAMGNTWRAIQRRNALRNVLAPIIMNVASSMRLLVAELILVEWIFSWPGIGQLLAQTLIPPATASVGGLGLSVRFFLFPPLVALLLTIFAFLFLMIDSISSLLSQMIDPRLQDTVEPEAYHG